MIIPAEPKVLVGGCEVSISHKEWVWATLPKGARITVFPQGGEPYPAVVIGSIYYDGVLLHVWDVTCIDNPIKVLLVDVDIDIGEPMEVDW